MLSSIIQRLEALPEIITSVGDIRAALQVPVGTGLSLPTPDQPLKQGGLGWSRRALLEWARNNRARTGEGVTLR